MRPTSASNPYLIDDENPEWTDETFARARPAREVLGEQLGAEVAAKLLKPKRGRPVKAAPKRPTNIRFSPEVLAHFRATGKGWQTRMDEVLKRHVATRTRRPSATKRTSGRRTARA